ncbi:MAG: kelch repeat-containing protein, partial [Chloroflexota bacterium]
MITTSIAAVSAGFAARPIFPSPHLSASPSPHLPASPSPYLPFDYNELISHSDDAILAQLAEKQARHQTVDPFQALQEQAAGPPHLYGQWSDLVDWPTHATHAALMPDRSILTWHATYNGIDIYDIESGTHQDVRFDSAEYETDIFCTGFSHLPDGRLVVVGGNLPGKRAAVIFDHTAERFSRIGDMAFERYYGSATTLPSGEIFVFGGHSDAFAPTDVPEIYNPETGWRSLPDAADTIDHNFFHWVQPAPNGDLFYAGPNAYMHFIDTVGTGALQNFTFRDAIFRAYGSYAFYDVGKILYAGGFGDDGSSVESAGVIELSADSDEIN